MTTPEHDWKACPHKGDADLDKVVLRKPNHFYHDSLGCPYECNEDHNHPTPKQ
jgi:hypothetical protein